MPTKEPNIRYGDYIIPFTVIGVLSWVIKELWKRMFLVQWQITKITGIISMSIGSITLFICIINTYAQIKKDFKKAREKYNG